MTTKLLNLLKEYQINVFNINSKHLNLTNKYKYLNETCIFSLLCIIHYLEINGYTLTHICLNDFEVYDQYLFLVKDTHIVELVNDTYIYTPLPKEKIEFIPKDISHNNHKYILYKSVGLFMYYLVTRKIKNKITEKELDVLYYSKPYFFIKNTIDNKQPCLIYL